EVSRTNEKDATLGILGSDLLQHVLGDILRDQLLERRIIGKSIVEQRRKHAALLEHVLLADCRVNRFQLLVIFWAEKSEWSGQRPCADACNELDLRPCPTLRPADQQSGPERTILPTAGHRQVVGRR